MLEWQRRPSGDPGEAFRQLPEPRLAFEPPERAVTSRKQFVGTAGKAEDGALLAVLAGRAAAAAVRWVAPSARPFAKSPFLLVFLRRVLVVLADEAEPAQVAVGPSVVAAVRAAATGKEEAVVH